MNNEIRTVFFTGECHTQEETAEIMGISRSRVIELENRALAKMRAAFERLGIYSVADAMAVI